MFFFFFFFINLNFTNKVCHVFFQLISRVLPVDNLHTTVFFLYISYIEKDDPVCGLPSPYISIGKVSSAQGHGNCLYIT